MGDKNPIRTLGDYSRPSHEGYRNTIELLEGNNVVPLRSDTIRLVQNSLSPQPQALNITFKARVRDYMAAHTERMGRFENAILKQREEINGRMTKMFGLLKELTTSRTSEKLLIREEAKFPVTKNVNSISLANKDKERSNERMETPENTEKSTKTGTETPLTGVETKDEAENRSEKKSIKTHENDEVVGAPAILKKKITKKEDIGGNFEIPCSVGGLKHVNALVDQGSDVNIMPYSTYMKLIDERPTKTDIKLSLASHSYIYPLGIVEDVLVQMMRVTMRELEGTQAMGKLGDLRTLTAT
ncbi:hypothetical protein Tco_0099432 [Tanacetum coccineum]